MTKKQIAFLILLLISLNIYADFKESDKKRPVTAVIYLINDTIDFSRLKYEMAEVVFKDGLVIYLTSFNPREIIINIHEFNKILKIYKRRMVQVKSIMHNHFQSGKFSDSDNYFLSRLRQYGFRGEFLIWCKNKVYKSNF